MNINLNLSISYGMGTSETYTSMTYTCYSAKHFNYHEIQKQAKWQVDQQRDKEWAASQVYHMVEVILSMSGVNPLKSKRCVREGILLLVTNCNIFQLAHILSFTRENIRIRG
jgi:hypothetical protein